MIGLCAPSAGDVRVLGWSARKHAQVVLPRIGFVAQEHPLYRGFRLDEMLKLGRKMNPRWDDGLARRRLERLGIPLGRKVGTLSGGQQAQVALTLALAKRPELLVLDEPVAALDPLARREFLQSLMEAVADGGLTVVLSSHIVAELERVCDHLVILAAGGVRLAELDRAGAPLASTADRPAARHRVRRAPPRRDPRASHRAPVDSAGAHQRPCRGARLERRRGRSGGDRARLPGAANAARAVRAGAASRGGGVVIWVAWRQQRTETLIAALLLALIAAVVVPTGLQMASVYEQERIAACIAQPSDSCRETLDAFAAR